MITVGQVLKNKRRNLRKSLDVVSSDTKIQKRFIKYMESDEFSPFESEVFLKGFIKIYAEYLGLDVKKVLALYRRTNPVVKQKQKIAFPKKIANNRRLFFNPQTLITILITIFTLGILLYIGYQIYRFQTPPKLNILHPPLDFVTEEEFLHVKGSTEKGIIIEINDVVTPIDESATFEKNIKLNEGINIVTIKAKKNSNNVLETVDSRKVTYNKPVLIEKDNEVIKEDLIKLEVLNASTWIKLDVDSINKLVQVVKPSSQEFVVKNTIHVITGVLSNTKLYFNGQLIEWKAPSTGVNEIQCSVKDHKISCN